MKKKFLLMALALLLITGCGGSGAPKCSDNDVKKLVLEIANKENRNQLTTQFVGNRFTYNALKQMSDDDAKAIIEQIDSQLANISMSLTGIRASGQDDKIRKCQCGANLALSNGKSLSIKYTAQYTEDGQIYVEVFGL